MKRSVTAVIFKENRSQVLVIKRRDVPVWALPGGSIDNNETPEEAVTREAFEETGLRITAKRKVGIYTPVNRLTTPTHVFECEVESGSLKTGNETKDLGFFPIDALPEGSFHVHVDMIHDALLQKTEVLQRRLTQVTYWKLFTFFLKHPVLVTRFALSQLGFPINT